MRAALTGALSLAMFATITTGTGAHADDLGCDFSSTYGVFVGCGDTASEAYGKAARKATSYGYNFKYCSVATTQTNEPGKLWVVELDCADPQR